VELRIAGIEMVEGGVRIRVAATAGGAAVDMAQVNGVISVAVGDDLGALVPRPVCRRCVHQGRRRRSHSHGVSGKSGMCLNAKVVFVKFAAFHLRRQDGGVPA